MLVECYGEVFVPVHAKGVFIVEPAPPSMHEESLPRRCFIRHIDSAQTNQSYSTAIHAKTIVDEIEIGTLVLRMSK